MTSPVRRRLAAISPLFQAATPLPRLLSRALSGRRDLIFYQSLRSRSIPSRGANQRLVLVLSPRRGRKGGQFPYCLCEPIEDWRGNLFSQLINSLQSDFLITCLRLSKSQLSCMSEVKHLLIKMRFFTPVRGSE